MTNGNEYDFAFRHAQLPQNAAVTGPLWVVFPSGTVPRLGPPCLCWLYEGRRCPQCIFDSITVTTTSGTGDSR